MSLLNLAFRNIRLNRKKYIMYLFSMGFSVFTVYTFLALMQNPYVKMAFDYDTRYRMLLTSFGIIIMVFVFFFLISSNNSFIRARKKEISTYALFGMPNFRIGGLLFLETILVGTTTLIVGIGAGIFFSKLMAMFLIDLCLTNFVGDVSFSIDPRSIVLTTLVFYGIFVLMGLSAFRIIYRFELADLFKADKISEGKSNGSVVMLFVSLALIGGGYFLASSSDPMVVVLGAIPILILVITGTYLFFWGGMPKVLHLIRKNKKVYYRGTTLISASSVSHRMRSTASVMATIAVLSAVAATAIATGFTLYSNAEKNTYQRLGFDLTYDLGTNGLGDQLHEVFSEQKAKITEEKTVYLNDAVPKVKDVYVEKRQHLQNGDRFRAYSVSEFNQLLSSSQIDHTPVNVKAGEVYYSCPIFQDGVEEAMLGLKLGFGDQALLISQVDRISFPGFGIDHILVLNDSDFNQLQSEEFIKPSMKNGKADAVVLINFDGALSGREVNEAINAVFAENGVKYLTSYNLYNESMQIFGLICFIGFFMSGVFILMTASLLYFKQIMAAEEEKHQYRMLRRIGMDDDAERKVIVKRLLPVFFIPLATGIIHSTFAMKTADTVVFSNMIPVENTYLSVLQFSGIMYLAYAAVYGVFYLITKSQYTRIVRS